MNFRPELATKVMAGEKTVTRRLCSDNPRSPWWREECSLRNGSHYAVCPGRGEHQIGRVIVTHIRKERLSQLATINEARQEGFPSVEAFRDAFTEINGAWEPDLWVWRIQFKLPRAADQSREMSE